MERFNHPSDAPPGRIFTLYRPSKRITPLKTFVAQRFTALDCLLICGPLAATRHLYGWDVGSGVRLLLSCTAIIPITKWLGDSVDAISESLIAESSSVPDYEIDWIELSATVVGAVYGNALEFIIGVAAVLDSNFRLAQTFIVGSILARILLRLGCAFISGGLRQRETNFSTTAAQTGSSLMTLSCITLIIPAAYHASKIHATPLESHPSPDETDRPGLLIISRTTAVLLLFVYGAFLNFQLRTHVVYFTPPEEDYEESDTKLNMPSAFVLLGIATASAALCSKSLVASIKDGGTEALGIHPIFFGIIVLPFCVQILDIAKIFTTAKPSLPVTIGLCVGGAIQITNFVIPLLVLLACLIGRPFTLFFANFETIILSISVVLVNSLIMDGVCNYLEGCLLLALYGAISLAVFVS